MEEIKVFDIDSYKNLIIEYETVKKKAERTWIGYVYYFGELLEKRLAIYIERIKMKKMIEYCQMLKNRDLPIVKKDVEIFVDRELAVYYDDLESLSAMRKDKNNTKSISEYTLHRLKKLYRKIAFLIHPDINPEFAENEKIKSLWKEALNAYKRNDYEDLERISILIFDEIGEDYSSSEIQIENLEEKIKELHEKIDKIINSKPYVYRYVLNDEEALRDHEEEINNEIAEYEQIVKQLKQKLNEFFKRSKKEK